MKGTSFPISNLLNLSVLGRRIALGTNAATTIQLQIPNDHYAMENRFPFAGGWTPGPKCAYLFCMSQKKLNLPLKFSFLAIAFWLMGISSGAVTLVVDQSGKAFDLPKSKPILVSLFFSACQSECSTVNMRLRDLVKEFPDIPAASISVDPMYDEPHVLRQYVKKFGFGFANWSFVTGTPQGILDFVRHRLQMHWMTGTLVHSPDIFLYSASGNLLGQFAPTDEIAMATLRKKLATLKISKD